MEGEKSYRAKLIEVVVNHIISENVFEYIDLKDTLQKKLNSEFNFKTTVSDITNKNGINFGEVYFSDETNEKHVLNFWCQHTKANENTDTMDSKNCKRCKDLEFMIKNGLGWDDLKNDITFPRS